MNSLIGSGAGYPTLLELRNTNPIKVSFFEKLRKPLRSLGEGWLGGRDSNPNSQDQNLMSCL